MRIYRVENIKLRPILVLAQDHDDAADILANAMIHGMGNRPDADFDVVHLSEEDLDRPPPVEWINADRRGLIWPTDVGDGWELVHTKLENHRSD